MVTNDDVHWVVQQNMLPAATLQALRAAFARVGVSYEEVVSIPFSDELPTLQQPAASCIFYGSTTLVMNAWRAGYRDGVFFDPAAFTMRNYLRQWPGRLLNADACLESLAAFTARPHPADSQWFVRPDDDSKCLAGQVRSFAELQAWAQRLAHLPEADLTPATLLLFSSPKTIEKEWRHVVVGGRVVASVRYLWHGELRVSEADVPPALLAFVAECLTQYQPHDVFVLDTALAEGKHTIIECNCFNGTGFYQADITPIVAAVTEWRQQQR